MKCQVAKYLSERELLQAYQSGFRPKYSTTTALLKVAHDLCSAQNAKRKVVSFLLLLDFSKAFDSVNYVLMINKLRERFFFGSSALKLI